MKESEDALRELLTAFKNVGLPPATIVLMLTELAEEVRRTIQ